MRTTFLLIFHETFIPWKLNLILRNKTNIHKIFSMADLGRGSFEILEKYIKIREKGGNGKEQIYINEGTESDKKKYLRNCEKLLSWCRL